jgi:hypothetical protein
MIQRGPVVGVTCHFAESWVSEVLGGSSHRLAEAESCPQRLFERTAQRNVSIVSVMSPPG